VRLSCVAIILATILLGATRLYLRLADDIISLMLCKVTFVPSKMQQWHILMKPIMTKGEPFTLYNVLYLASDMTTELVLSTPIFGS